MPVGDYGYYFLIYLFFLFSCNICPSARHLALCGHLIWLHCLLLETTLVRKGVRKVEGGLRALLSTPDGLVF